MSGTRFRFLVNIPYTCYDQVLLMIPHYMTAYWLTMCGILLVVPGLVI